MSSIGRVPAAQVALGEVVRREAQPKHHALIIGAGSTFDGSGNPHARCGPAPRLAASPFASRRCR
jgi:hypothetical protein